NGLAYQNGNQVYLITLTPGGTGPGGTSRSAPGVAPDFVALAVAQSSSRKLDLVLEQGTHPAEAGADAALPQGLMDISGGHLSRSEQDPGISLVSTGEHKADQRSDVPASEWLSASLVDLWFASSLLAER